MSPARPRVGRLLLDTHVVIWWLADDPTLGDDLKQAIDETPDVYVSVASIWEVTIKQARGKIKAPSDLPERITASGLDPLAITSGHAIEAARLPDRHRDPFDRMLIAQTRHDGLTLVTRDQDIQGYDVPLLPA